MYSSSLKTDAWCFKSGEELARLRFVTNLDYISKFKKGPRKGLILLTVDEELIIVKHFQKILKDFLQKFMPRNEMLPREVKATTFHYFKRFYLCTSVMDFHPKDIMLACTFLSCKVCDYVIPIDEFVWHVEKHVECNSTKQNKQNKTLLKNIILDQELEVLDRIKFRIHIVNPSQYIFGLIFDLKTHCRLRNPDRLNEHMYRFMSGMWFTDVCILYSPRIIALAAVMFACARCKENVGDFIKTNVLNCQSGAAWNCVVKVVNEIRTRVVNQKPLPSLEEIARLEAQLSRCRNPYNDPSSHEFQERMKQALVPFAGVPNQLSW